MATITVTYVANANPSIQVQPDNPRVGKGSNVLSWNCTNCTFPATGGIVFVPDASAPAVWPYAQPTLQADGTYQTIDENPGGQTVTYNYNVTIISRGGSQHTRQDPDVTNTPE